VTAIIIIIVSTNDLFEQYDDGDDADDDEAEERKMTDHRRLRQMNVEHCPVLGHVTRRIHQFLHLLTRVHIHTHKRNDVTWQRELKLIRSMHM